MIDPGKIREEIAPTDQLRSHDAGNCLSKGGNIIGKEKAPRTTKHRYTERKEVRKKVRYRGGERGGVTNEKSKLHQATLATATIDVVVAASRGQALLLHVGQSMLLPVTTH